MVINCLSNAKDLTVDKQTKVSNLFDLLLNNDVICNDCVKNTAAENKIILVYEASKKESGGGYEFKSTSLKFGYCEQHKSNSKCSAMDCGNNACYIMWCGHKICEQHLNGKMNIPVNFVVCKECNVVCCNLGFRDHFDTHLWCSDAKKGHYFCFKDMNDYNPYKKKDKFYKEAAWLCQDHNLFFE